MHKKAPANRGKGGVQTTAMKGTNVNPMRGVVKPEILAVHIKQCVNGIGNSCGYVRGALQYLSRKPPNPHIVPLLELAIKRAS